MTAIDHARWARYLAAGVDERRELQAITKQVDELSIDDAYAIQAALLELQLGRGDILAGAKLGLTSAAKQEQMGVSEPVYGWVPASTVVANGGEIDLSELIHPRCEPELVFVMSEDLAGPGVSAGDVLDATEKIVGGIEIIDSRYEAFSFTLPDVIADNTSAARVILGSDGIGPRDQDAASIECWFDIDGAEAGAATGAALLGSPAECVAHLANHVGKAGLKLQAGWHILAGAVTDAKPFTAGTNAQARYSSLGPVSVSAK